VEHTTDGVLIGMPGFAGTDSTPSWAIDRQKLLGPGHTQAAHRLIRHLFETLGFERVWTYPDNAASKRVLEKLG
jgi:8-oxo-dGTP diphosphatase